MSNKVNIFSKTCKTIDSMIESAHNQVVRGNLVYYHQGQRGNSGAQ